MDEGIQGKKIQAATGNESLRMMIHKIYEEQNSEKIKIANQIINRSVFQRARATFDSTSNRNTSRFHQTSMGLPLFNDSTLEEGASFPQILSKKLQISG